MPRNVYKCDTKILKIQVRESDIYGYAPTFLFLQPVRIDAGQSAHKRRFAVVVCPAVPAMICLTLLLLLVSAARAQESSDVTFKSGVANVRVDAQVIQDGNVVTDLTAKDFIVREDDRPQPIVYFGREKEPLSLVLLLDVSGSMRKHVEQVADVARRSLRFLRPSDRVAVMAFARESRTKRVH